MGKILSLVLLLLVAACSLTRTEVEPIAAVEKMPLQARAGAEITPLLKPRPNIHSKEYTAPYPKLSTSAPPTSSVVIAVPAPPPIKIGSRTTVTEKRILDIDVTRGAVSTDEFLGKKKNLIYSPQQEPVEMSKEEYDKTVLGKAMKLPPKEIEEGRYRTFRGIENDVLHDTRKIRGKVAEFLFPEMNDVVEKPQGKPQPEIFCYKSLGDSSCYPEPIEGQEFRRVGKVDDRFK
jgi:hypothetical protein